MALRIRLVKDSQDWTILGPFGKDFNSLPKGPKNFWNGAQLSQVPANASVVATDKGKVVGFFRFIITYNKGKRKLKAAGTYIYPQYRKKNLAKKMWVKALETFKIQEVEVRTISKGGRALVKWVAATFPIKLDWTHVK